MFKKSDFLIAAIVGLVTALLSFPVLKNLGLAYAFLFLLPAMPVLWVVGIWLGKFLARWLSFMYQFAKFVVVGFLNTVLDFSVLNLMSILTGITGGLIVGGINVPGFILAAVNSYFWNKFWVFRKEKAPGEKTNYGDFSTFIVVTICGALINSGIVILVTTYTNPLFGFSPERWLNVAKVLATAISLIFNFLGYKFLVFKSKTHDSGALSQIPAEKI